MIRLLWLIPIIAVYITVAWFLKLYIKDKDKRKLLFSFVFVVASIDYLVEFLDIPFHSNVIISNIYFVASIPLQIMILVAVIETIRNIEDFDRMFLFLVALFISFLIVSFLPISMKGVLLPLRVALAVETICISFYSFLRKRDKDALLFGFSLVSFTMASVGMARNIPELSIFSFTIAYVFLALIFMGATEEEGISSYFALKRRLEETEKKLRLSEKKYRIIVENTSDVIMLNNRDGIITYVSPSCERLFGYKADEFIGKVPWELNIIHPDDVRRVAMYHREAMEGSCEKPVEYRIITKNGETKWVSHLMSVVRDEKGRTVMIISSYRDVTTRKEIEQQLSLKVEELKRAEDEIKKKNKELEELNKYLEKKVQERTEEVKKLLRAKEEILLQIGHDIKTPLTPLCILLPLARDLSDNIKVRELLDVCIRNANYMKRLVASTMHLLNVDDIKLFLEDISLLDQVKELLEAHMVNLQKKRIKVSVLIDEDIFVRADRVRLREILENLLSNAIKYSTEGGKISIGAERDGEMVKIFIRDNGIGMTKEQLEHIFEEFYKGDESRHDLASVGLGLSICKKLVEKHGGKIWAESKGIGKGSTFYFTLPAASPREKIETTPAS